MQMMIGVTKIVKQGRRTGTVETSVKKTVFVAQDKILGEKNMTENCV